jgi:S1-C subfamily serine protease
MALYSSSRRPAAPAASWSREPSEARGPAFRTPEPSEAPSPSASGGDDWLLRESTPWLAALSALVAIGALILNAKIDALRAPAAGAAAMRPLQAAQMPSAAQAYEIVRPSVVRVRAFGKAKDKTGEKDKETETNVGTGVVILETGKILTNLHVVAGAERVGVVFADGSESDARVEGLRPEHDLAVLQASVVPDDLKAATMTTTGGLRPGDLVVAVGYPFGIGPSVSAGVVSGLRREYYSAQGERLLTNLVQFDAAANPGNSGGPLVNAKGEVVGIVTGLLNPTEGRFFIGIGFAVPIENAAMAVGMPPF